MIVIQDRKSIRLKNFDYSASGYYFLTICTKNREYLFGNVVNNEMILNEFGKIVDKKINELKKYKNINIDICCVMPNHVHLILIIVGAGPCACPPTDPHVRPLPLSSNNNFGSTQGSTPTVGEYVKRLKTLTTYIYINNVKKNNWRPFDKQIFQRNYYEHIIRNEKSLNKIRQYIRNNPINWDNDKNNLNYAHP